MWVLQLHSVINGFFKEFIIKFKPLYFYGSVFIIVVAVLIIISQQSGETTNNTGEDLSKQEMPNDEIHNPLKSNAPGRNNVSQEFKHKMGMLKKSVEENPSDTTKLLQYADLLVAAHQQKEAMVYYLKILSINPNRTDVLFSLSFIYYTLGDLKKSEEETIKILTINPGDLNAQYNLASIAATKGDKEKAKEIWKTLAEKYPKDQIGIKAKNSLEKL